jgi:hypothetical protein
MSLRDKGIVRIVGHIDYETPHWFMDAPSFSPGRQTRHRTLLVVAFGVVVLAVLLHVRGDQRVEFSWLPGFLAPEMCMSRSVLGIRCPGCGLTRSLIYLAHGDWRESLAMHRLGIVMAVAILAQFPYCAVGILWKKDYPLGRRFSVIVAWGLIVLLFGNWLVEMILGV